MSVCMPQVVMYWSGFDRLLVLLDYFFCLLFKDSWHDTNEGFCQVAFCQEQKKGEISINGNMKKCTTVKKQY